MSWVFCAIVAGEAAAIPIYEDDNYLAILDIRPFTRGHTPGRRLVKGWGSAQRCPSPKYVGELSQRENMATFAGNPPYSVPPFSPV